MAEETKPKRGRGRPSGKRPGKYFTPVAETRRAKREPLPKKVCAACHVEKPMRDYYKVSTPLCPDGLFLYCKDCTVKACLDENGRVMVQKLKSLLRQMDKPFIQSVLDAAVSEYENRWRPLEDGKVDQSPIVTQYLKNVGSLPQYSGLNNAQGEIMQRMEEAKRDKEVQEQRRALQAMKDDERVFIDEEDDDFDVTRDVVEQFGAGFTKGEYRAMQRKYAFLSQSYPEVSTLHRESLTLYCKYRVKEEFAIMNGDADAAEKWAALASKQADKAKINPSQLSQADLQNGASSISELFMQLEQKQDILTVLPRFKFAPNDAVDFLIWEYINYARRLRGESLIEYSEIWGFYDERKRSYVEQNGDPYHLFENDPTEQNRKSIEKFINIPKEYDGNGEDNG